MISTMNGLTHNSMTKDSVPNQTPRFGWSQKQPPKTYTVTLTLEDIDQHQNPTDAFVRKVSPFLMRGDNLEKPGFVMVSNLERHIPENRINRFLEKTTLALKAHLNDRYKALFNPANVELTAIKKRQIDGEIPEEGNLHTAETQGKWTLKSPHFDRNAHLVLHRYAPTENIKNGNLQVIDMQQLLKDHPDESLTQFLNPDRTIRKDKWTALAPYTLTLPTNSSDHKVVFLHNTLQNGVAHGVTPLQPMDERKPMKRVFERYTVTPFVPGKKLPPDVQRIE